MTVSRGSLVKAFGRLAISSMIAGGALLSASAAMAQGQIKVPQDLCNIQPVPAALASEMAARTDYEDILKYLNNNCPAQALAFADQATGSIPAATVLELLGREGWQVNKNGRFSQATDPTDPTCEEEGNCPPPPPPPNCEDDDSCPPPPSCEDDDSCPPPPSCKDDDSCEEPEQSCKELGNCPPETDKIKYNNGKGNGDQDAPGKSCTRNNAENAGCTSSDFGNGRGRG